MGLDSQDERYRAEMERSRGTDLYQAQAVYGPMESARRFMGFLSFKQVHLQPRHYDPQSHQRPQAPPHERPIVVQIRTVEEFRSQPGQRANR